MKEFPWPCVHKWWANIQVLKNSHRSHKLLASQVVFTKLYEDMTKYIDGIASNTVNTNSGVLYIRSCLECHEGGGQGWGGELDCIEDYLPHLPIKVGARSLLGIRPKSQLPQKLFPPPYPHPPASPRLSPDSICFYPAASGGAPTCVRQQRLLRRHWAVKLIILN